jgi:hypothetical protein
LESVLSGHHEDGLDNFEGVLLFLFIKAIGIDECEELLYDIGIFKDEVYAVDLVISKVPLSKYN